MDPEFTREDLLLDTVDGGKVQLAAGVTPELTVAAGTTLRFVNRGANWHSVAAFDGSFDSGRVEPGTSFEVRLEVPGVYDIICKHHGLRGMIGRIIVT